MVSLMKSRLIAAAVFAILAILFCFPILKGSTNWGILDWDQHTFYHAVPRETILRYHQFPLWNPYYCGGNVMLANMQARFLSPTFTLLLFFGTLPGLKIEIIFHIMIGMWGMYLLCRHLGLGKYASYFPAIVFMCNGRFVLHLTEGQTWFMPIAYLPFVVLFYLKSIKQIKYGLLSGAFLGLMILEGGVYPAPHTALFLGLMTLFLTISGQYRMKPDDKSLTGRLTPIRAFGFVLLFAVLFSAIKLLPTLEFYQQYPRHIECHDHLTSKMVYNIFLSRNQDFWLHYPEQHYGWWEYGTYIGVVPLILSILGLFPLNFRGRLLRGTHVKGGEVRAKQRLGLSAKRIETIRASPLLWPWMLTGIIFFVIGLGSFTRYAPWNLLHDYLLVFRSHRVPSRFMMIPVFCLAIPAGMFLSKLETHQFKEASLRKTCQWIVIGMAMFVFADLCLVNGSNFGKAFPYASDSIKLINPHATEPVPKRDKQGRVNLALLPDAKPNASSVLPGYAIHQIAHLSDGLYGNDKSWISNGEPSWAEIDLGDVYEVDKVAFGSDHLVALNDRAASKFDILVATTYDENSDATTWERVYKYHDAPVHTTKRFTFKPHDARWVRIHIWDGTTPQVRIDEIEIYGSLLSTEPITKSVKGKSKFLKLKWNEEFHHMHNNLHYGPWSAMYPAFLRNEGTLNGYEPTHFPTRALAYNDPNYQGEVFFIGTEQNNETKVHLLYWSPNKIIANVTNASAVPSLPLRGTKQSDDTSTLESHGSPGAVLSVKDGSLPRLATPVCSTAQAFRVGTLVLNQNFAKDWKAISTVPKRVRRPVESYNGLVSTHLFVGDKQIVFYYLPVSFIIGCVITIGTIIGSLLYYKARG